MSTSLSISNQSFDTVTASCPASKRAIAGGFRQPDGLFVIHQSFATSTGDGWSVQGFNRQLGPGGNTLTAFAVCAFVS